MARRRDVDAKLRLGVRWLRGVEGLVASVVEAAGVPRASLSSRAGWDEAFARIRAGSPADGLGPPRLTASQVPTRKVVSDLRVARRVARRHPGIEDVDPGSTWAVDLAQSLGIAVDATRESEAPYVTFLRVHAVTKAGGVGVADVRDANHLVELLAAGRKAGDGAVACRHVMPREWRRTVRYALEYPVRDLVALAHARDGAVGATVHVVVAAAHKVEVRRGTAETGVRLLQGRPWHRDPEVAERLRAAAADWCRRHAAWRVVAEEGAPWCEALLHDLEVGYEAHVRTPDGRVAHHVVPDGAWDPQDPRGSVTRALALPRQVEARRQRHVVPSGEVMGQVEVDGRPRPDVCQELFDAVLDLPRGRRVAFAKRVQSLAERGSHVAVVTFEENASTTLRAIASLVLDVGDAKGLRQRSQGSRLSLMGPRVSALATASGHRDPDAVLRAARRVPTLEHVARCRGAWRGASDVLADGGSDTDALRRLASDVTGWPATKAVARVLRDHHRTHRGVDDLELLAAVAVGLAVAAPNRPMPTVEDLVDVTLAARTLEVPLRPVDPLSVLALATGLEDPSGERGPAGVAREVRDACHAFDRTARLLGIEGAALVALREEAFFPKGRNRAGLLRISEEWHRRANREVRERDALVSELRREQHGEDLSAAGDDVPWEYPAPFEGQVMVDGVTVVPLRDTESFDEEAFRQSSCVAGYREEARTGRLLVHSLRSPDGRSTAGHWVDVRGDHVTFVPFQHAGDQGGGNHSAEPPQAHVLALAKTMAGLDGEDGLASPGWRSRMADAQRAHVLRRNDVTESSLTPERRARLRALTMAHFGRLLGKREAALDHAGLVAHAADLVAGRTADLDRLRVSLARAAPRRGGTAGQGPAIPSVPMRDAPDGPGLPAAP